MENFCYYFVCDNLDVCDYKKDECIKVIEKEIEGIKFVFYIVETNYEGQLLKNENSRFVFPVKETFYGWEEVCNSYFCNKINDDKINKLFRLAGFFSLKECEQYINEDFVNIYKDFCFNF